MVAAEIQTFVKALSQWISARQVPRGFHLLKSRYKQEMQRISLSRLLSACIDLGNHSGQIIRDVLASGNLNAIDKRNPDAVGSSRLIDPQTEADLRSQKLIIGSLTAAFPGLRIVGEEGELQIDQKDIIQPRTDLISDPFPADLEDLPLEELCVWIGWF